MSSRIQKSIVAMLIFAISLSLISSALLNNKSIDPKIARAEAISKIEMVEDMDISANQYIQGNANTQSLKTIAPTNDVFVNGEVLVKFKTLEGKNNFAAEKGANYNFAATSRLAKLKVGDSYDMKMTELAISNLKSDSRVEYAEPNYLGFSMTSVNDTYFNRQWHLENNGSFQLNSHSNYDINIKKAWDITQGTSETVIAVIDSAVDFPNAPEIADSILRDANGKVIGKNFAENCEYTNSTGVLDPNCNTTDKFADHATTGVGLITAKTNDNNGVAGICPNCKIIPLGIKEKVSGRGQTVSRMINSITYALANGADIITSSVGFTADPNLLTSLQNATNNAISGGVFL